MYHLMTIVVVDIMTIVVEIIIAAAMIAVDMIIVVMVVVVAMTVAATVVMIVVMIVVMTVAAMIAVDERKFANDRFSQWIQDKHKLQIPEILAWKIQPWGCVFRPAA